MENVIKQGYLRKGFPSDRGFSGLLDKIDPTKWFVFLVRGGTPFLEYYDKQHDVFSSEPVNSFDLTTCKQVTFTFLRNARIHRFNIILEDRIIELASTSRELMISWCDCLESTLHRLGIYRKDDHDHVYSFCPAVVNKGGPKGDEDTMTGSDVEGATSNYSLPDEYIFGTVREVDDKREKLKNKEEMAEKDKIARKISVESEEDSDYSGDFVGEEFFRKHRINTGEKKSDSLGRSVVKSERQSVFVGALTTPKNLEDSNNNNFNSGSCVVDDLDDGYSELLCTKKNEASSVIGQNGSASSSSTAMSSSSKTNSSQHIKYQGSFPEDLSKEKLTVDLPEASCCSSDTCVKTASTGSSAAGCQAQTSGQINSSSSSSDNQRAENLYSDFPCPQDTLPNTSPKFSETSLKIVDPLADRPIVAAPNMKPLPKKRTSVLQSAGTNMPPAIPFSNWETFDSEVPVQPSAATVQPPLRPPPRPHDGAKGETSNGIVSIPPLPPRFDSLPSWGSVSMDETALKQQQGASYNMSQSAFESSDFDEPIPPLPPRRDSKRSQRSASTSDAAPPLPARKSQSFRIQRPITSPPNLANSTNGAEAAAPPPRRPDRQLSMRMRVERGHSAHTVISLKHNQIDILLGEILSAAVVREIDQKSGLGLALVDVQDKVWIAGWNWKDYPGLHSKFHVGDQVLSINSSPVENAQSARKMLKHATGPSEIVVRRLPHAKVFEIRREAEGQSLGIKREGGTGEIIYVDPNGLAAQNGLPMRAECVLMPGMVSSWYFTEINSRPVGLFFKGLEIEHRLNAVGLELSFVVQPSDFISELKKQLQKKIKNYKNFLPQ